MLAGAEAVNPMHLQVLVALSLLASLLFTPGLAADDLSYEREIRSGEQATKAGQFERAEKLFAGVAHSCDADSPLLPIALRHLGDLYFSQKNYPAAEHAFLKQLEALKGFGASSEEIHASLTLARISAAQHRYADGAAFARKALDLIQSSAETHNPDEKELAFMTIISCELKLHKYSADVYDQYYRFKKQRLGANTRAYATTLVDMSGWMIELHNDAATTRAGLLCSEALSKAHMFRNDQSQEQFLQRLANTCNALGQYDEAVFAWRRALTICEAIEGPHSLNTAYAAANLGHSLFLLGRYADAKRAENQALRIMEKQKIIDDCDRARISAYLACSCFGQGECAQGQKFAEQAMAIWQRRNGRITGKFALSTASWNAGHLLKIWQAGETKGTANRSHCQTEVSGWLEKMSHLQHKPLPD